MVTSELSGLVLTHADRDPSACIDQLSQLCGQVVVVNDSRFGEAHPAKFTSASQACEITVVNRGFDIFARQRNAGLEQTIGAWTLLVDSDELLSPELSQEIADLDTATDADIYAIQRQEYLNGKPLAVSNPVGRIGMLHPRLFRSELRYADHPSPHERLEREHLLTVVPLTGKLEHFPQESIQELLVKNFRYGRLYDVPEDTGEAPQTLEVLKDLVQFVRYDKLRGAAMAAIVLAFGVGTKFPRPLESSPQTPTRFIQHPA